MLQRDARIPILTKEAYHPKPAPAPEPEPQAEEKPAAPIRRKSTLEVLNGLRPTVSAVSKPQRSEEELALAAKKRREATHRHIIHHGAL